MNPKHQVTIRSYVPERDDEQLLALDISYKSGGYWDVIQHPDRIELSLRHRQEKHRFSFPLTSADLESQSGWVAVAADRLTGFLAVDFQSWNKRLCISHFYVDCQARRQGLGRRLMETALAYGVSIGAQVAWAETSNHNLLGIEAYQQLGFQICGFDASLYCGTPATGQGAVFLARELSTDK